ncbi:MAG TPA: hypothetical protein VF228_24960 [Iamia sp.]
MPTTTPASTRPNGRPRRRWRRPSALVAAVALLVGVAAACEPDTTPPGWLLVDRADATALGPHVALEWDAAYGSPSRYRIDVNGVTAAWVGPTATRCVMVGLAAATAYTFRITAYDAAGNWSDSLPIDGQHDPGFRPASRTTPAGPGGGPTLRCVPVADTDFDRLPDALETNTGTFAHTAATGTSPTVVDTDVDGLDDGDEVLGTVGGLDLYGLGTRPMRPDLLVEVDWLAGYQRPGCTPDLPPQTSWWTGAIDGFARTYVPTPGGHQGINLIVDQGQGGVFTGGNPIPHPTGDAGYPDGYLDPVGDPHLATNRAGYFHHALILGRWWGGLSWSTRPLAEFEGSRFWLIADCGTEDPWDASSDLVHEMGHNLGLHHGGSERTNLKPSYNSVMNYRYYTGLDRNCDDVSDWGANRRLGFSAGIRPPLDEAHVVEAAGVCGNVPLDMDGDMSIDATPYARDLNGDGSLRVLHDHDDLANLDLKIFASNRRSGRAPELVVEDGP